MRSKIFMATDLNTDKAEMSYSKTKGSVDEAIRRCTPQNDHQRVGPIKVLRERYGDTYLARRYNATPQE